MPLPNSALPQELTGDLELKTNLGHESDEIAGNQLWTDPILWSGRVEIEESFDGTKRLLTLATGL